MLWHNSVFAALISIKTSYSRMSIYLCTVPNSEYKYAISFFLHPSQKIIMENINKNFFSCNQKWAEMPIKNNKRWCEKCSQCLVDFRTMHTSEIKHIHENSATKVCGVYNKNQLVKLYPPEKPFFNFSFYNKKIAAAIFTFFSLTTVTYGQSDSLILDNQKKQVCPIRTPKLQTPTKTEKKAPALPNSILIKGTISDTSGEVLIGVSIVHTKSQKGTVSDLDGNYTLLCPAEMGDTLVLSCIGFESFSIKIGNSNIIDVSLVENISLKDCVALGYGYETPPTVIRKTSTRRFWRRIFKKR